MLPFAEARTFCAFEGGRLPTDDEWTFAAMGPTARRYPWGDEPTDAKGSYLLNFWQGESHTKNDRLDGFVYVSPVRAFPPNAWGLYDPAGNVWQWTATAYVTGDAAAGTERVLRGGSWWCAACTCEGYGLWYRGHTEARAAFSNSVRPLDASGSAKERARPNGQHRQGKEDDEQNLRDRRGGSRQSAKAECGCCQRKNEEHKRPTKHNALLRCTRD